jgi:predicted  nucleic acid-binding Zn-ribbon protein
MVIDAAHDSLVRLLDLQAEDSAIKRLNERRNALPEAQRLAELTDQIAELDADIEIATKQVDEVTREQSRLEGEIGLADQKIAREEQRLFSGSVSNPKELGSLQAEVGMLKRKKGEVEDSLLEVMVQKDQASETLARLQAERTEAAAESEELAAKVSSVTGEIETELKEHEAKRAEVAATIDEPLLKLYEQIRSTKGGVGVAALEAATCQGCHTKLPAKEIERIKAEGGVQRCDNCRRILVIV